MINTKDLQALIALAIREDIGSGDHSSLACFQDDGEGEAVIYAKETGVIAGVDLAKHVFHEFDNELKYIPLVEDGASVKPGTEIAKIIGNKQHMLTAERTVLNFMQRMSGIATKTREYVDAIKGTHASVLDTRKTTPGFRAIEKEAVRIGGGSNHRFGLYDMIMLKDNHIDFAGGIVNAIKMANDYLKSEKLDIPIEIEVRNLAELEQVIEYGKVQRIMLDNFSVQDTKTAVNLVNNQFELESSGGITLETIRNYAECGVDFISVGALTHHIKSLDISLLVRK
ncbi:MAG: carboxylating nicotinate-nucleotide diphosphorylase [Bacteroidales bacterium]|jgi:nicotinate-nucleotide pyrophosphorylase (carboxylating)|nr:carboxylating nicotinate-nucleotide diphosphorylase [Bacteroidales bacterium]